jgi:hypothetical protein
LPTHMLFFDLSIYHNTLAWFIARQTVQVWLHVLSSATYSRTGISVIDCDDKFWPF